LNADANHVPRKFARIAQLVGFGFGGRRLRGV